MNLKVENFHENFSRDLAAQAGPQKKFGLWSRIRIILIKLGDLMHQVTSPVILGGLFFLVFTPLGLILKFLKKDVLDLSFPNRSLSTYWIESSDLPTNMKDQF